MDSAVAFRYLRTFIVTLVAMSFVFAPMAEAADMMHTEVSSTAVCADADRHTLDQQQEPSEDGHAHAPHHCGGCHIHILASGAAADSGTPPVQAERMSNLDDSPESTLPAGLYRPPRA